MMKTRILIATVLMLSLGMAAFVPPAMACGGMKDGSSKPGASARVHYFLEGFSGSFPS